MASPPELAATASLHEAGILEHLDRLPILADMLLAGTTPDLRSAFDEECRFMTLQLLPHIEAVEAAHDGRTGQTSLIQRSEEPRCTR